MINDINADTEFNDALRAHGIIAPKPPTLPSPSAFLPSEQELFQHALQSASANALGEMEEEAVNSDDERLFQSYRLKKLEEMKHQEKMARSVRAGDGLRPISRDDFVKEVNEASKRDIEGDDEEGKGTGVVCFLFKDGMPASDHMRNLLNTLSAHQPLIHFLSIPGPQCIPNYPDKNHPTLLLYRRGDCVGQLIGLPRQGMRTTVQDVERFLLSKGIAEKPSESLMKATKAQAGDGSGSDSDEDGEEDEDAEFGTMRMGKKGAMRGLRQGGTGLGLGLGGMSSGSGSKGRRKEDSDSDFDM